MPIPKKGKGYPRKWFLEHDDYMFEGHPIMGTKYYHEFLTYEFDVYMEFPPVEKRKVHPVSDIRLLEERK
jgi:lipopolysaccharide cholinephosphotransferase